MIEAYTGHSVLITGGAGFVGSALVSALSAIPCRITLLLRPGRCVQPIPNSRAEIILVHGDIRERQTWVKAIEGADYVFHLAAQTSGYVANQDPLADLEANVVPLIQLLEACRSAGKSPHILFSGTATQVGISEKHLVDESAHDLPLTVYDIHKLTGEKYLQCYARESGVTAVTLRLANVYGPGANVGSSDRGVLNLMIRNGLTGKPITVYGDGTRMRDYIFIDDVVSAFLTAGILAPQLSGNYYLIGSGQGIRIVDAFNLVADRINHASGFRPKVEHVPPPESLSRIEDRDFVADTRSFRSATKWIPRVSLADGIDRTVGYHMAQMDVLSGQSS